MKKSILIFVIFIFCTSLFARIQTIGWDSENLYYVTDCANRWLEDNKDIRIISATHASSMKRSNSHVFSLVIVYEEDDEKDNTKNTD